MLSYCWCSHFGTGAVIHFEPTGHSLRHAGLDTQVDVSKQYRDALERGAGGHENDHGGIPPYIIPGTPEESHWKAQHPDGYEEKKKSFTTGSTSAHVAAQAGNLKELEKLIKADKNVVNARDANGWTPLVER